MQIWLNEKAAEKARQDGIVMWAAVIAAFFGGVLLIIEIVKYMHG
jgi:hypothetical protein